MKMLAFIQARYSSTRFPGKVLADLHGKPVIQHVIERAQQIRHCDGVYVVMPHGEAEKPLIEWVAASGVWWWAVHDVPAHDVLGRFARAVEFRSAQIYLRITADCPMLQPDICDDLIDGWRASGCEYGWIDTSRGGWPDGYDCEVFTHDLLMSTHHQAHEPSDREHVTPWMRRNATVYSLPQPASCDMPKCSIDTMKDLERVRQMMNGKMSGAHRC